MVTFRVRAAALSEVGSLLGGVITTFDSNLNQVDSHVKRLVEIGWQGDDAEKFNEVWATFSSTAAMVRQSLVALQLGLYAADGSYTQNEAGVQRSMTGRMSAIQANRATITRFNTGVERGIERSDAILEQFAEHSDDEQANAVIQGAMMRPGSGQQVQGDAADDEDEGNVSGEAFVQATLGDGAPDQFIKLSAESPA